MIDFLQTFLISCVPAIITGTVSYLIANKNSVAQINVLKEQNKHDLEKLMEQHKIDIDSLNTKHQQEIEKMVIEHKHKLELLARESANNIGQNVLSELLGETMKMPEVKAEIVKSIRQSSNKKGGRH